MITFFHFKYCTAVDENKNLYKLFDIFILFHMIFKKKKKKKKFYLKKKNKKKKKFFKNF